MIPPLPSLNSFGKLPNLPPMFEPLSSLTLCSTDASSSISISPCPAGIFTHSTIVVPLSAWNGLAEKSLSGTATLAIWMPPTTTSGSLPDAVARGAAAGWPAAPMPTLRRRGRSRPMPSTWRLDVPAPADANEIHRLGVVLRGRLVAVDLVVGHGADLDQRFRLRVLFHAEQRRRSSSATP